MMPEILSDSYTRYKEDTNVFATWLTNTARLCGYDQSDVSQSIKSSEQPPNKLPTASTRLKGNARKEAKTDKTFSTAPTPLSSYRHTIPTREIIIQAGLVAGFRKPVVKVPLAIQGVLRRAINARKRCTVWFQQMTTVGSEEDYTAANSSHEHFISILERAQEILEPRFEKATPTATNIKKGNATDITAPMTNRFMRLEVEDTTDHDLDIDLSQAAVSTIGFAPTAKRANKKLSTATSWSEALKRSYSSESSASSKISIGFRTSSHRPGNNLLMLR